MSSLVEEEAVALSDAGEASSRTMGATAWGSLSGVAEADSLAEVSAEGVSVAGSWDVEGEVVADSAFSCSFTASILSLI